MEEGVPPLPPRPMPRPNSPRDVDANADLNAKANANTNDLSTAIIPFNKATYVVQAPKDQIFRVPPPENARIIEEHRNRIKSRRRTPRYCSHLAFILVILLAIVLLGLTAVLIFYFVAKPGVPHFNVDSISIVGPSSTKPEFDITMKAQNPSATMDLYYESGGNVDLSHQGRQIASGNPPEFNIGHKDITEIKLSLQGSKARLPKEFDSSVKESKDVVVPLSLSADFPVKLSFGALQMRKKELSITCDLNVRKLAKKLNVVSQNCKLKF